MAVETFADAKLENPVGFFGSIGVAGFFGSLMSLYFLFMGGVFTAEILFVQNYVEHVRRWTLQYEIIGGVLIVIQGLVVLFSMTKMGRRLMPHWGNFLPKGQQTYAELMVAVTTLYILTVVCLNRWEHKYYELNPPGAQDNTIAIQQWKAIQGFFMALFLIVLFKGSWFSIEHLIAFPLNLLTAPFIKSLRAALNRSKKM